MRIPPAPRRPIAAPCAALCLLLGAGLLGLTGCSAVAVRAPDAPAPSKVMLTANYDAAWETTVSTLHRFGFRTAEENKLDGTIETAWVVGSGLGEPWRDDSVGFANRLEDTLQSTRRRVVATVRPVAGEFGPEAYEVTIRAFKELEDVRGVVANTTGGATFQAREPIDRELQAVHGQFGPIQWVPLGRDPALENEIVAALGKK
ncbi:hypothetical protein [Alienimonas californiensis]|uniref:hypothetical protein n=1 Tax=Alienimonas californiensis TaxID=2527989 RepID=UPI0011A4077C|nr:hypothetical protein [Alienimonas californiensis]